jgi:hypothetical protein
MSRHLGECLVIFQHDGQSIPNRHDSEAICGCPRLLPKYYFCSSAALHNMQCHRPSRRAMNHGDSGWESSSQARQLPRGKQGLDSVTDRTKATLRPVLRAPGQCVPHNKSLHAPSRLSRFVCWAIVFLKQGGLSERHVAGSTSFYWEFPRFTSGLGLPSKLGSGPLRDHPAALATRQL